MKVEFLPGWILLVITTILAQYLSSLIPVSGKQVVEASALAIIIGMAARNLFSVPKLFLPGIVAAEKLLVLGIVLVGAKLNFHDIMSQGGSLLLVVVLTMTLSFFAICLLGRLTLLPKNLTTLLAVGTTICGTSAIAITAPLIHAKEEETSYAVATVALWGLAALLLYPLIASAVSVSDFGFGVFAGVAIHSTPQVVGAGYMFSDAAGTTATAVKLVRNCFMAPLALLLGILTSRREPQTESTKVNYGRAFPWFLFGYFVMAGLATKGYFSAKEIEVFNEIGKFLIIVGMAGVGYNTLLKTFVSLGFRPLIVGFLGAAIVAAAAAGLISLVL